MRMSRKRRCRAAGAVLAVLATVLAGGAGLTTTASAATQSTVKPLPADLEAIRAAEATALYGSPAIKPVDERRTGLISLGDSEISGEGVGTYEAGTDGPTNWCHRSPDSAIHRTGIPADETYNVACSGAYTGNIRIGGSKQYADELVQSDSLAIKARNTKIKMVLLVAGANDDLQFGPVITDCVERWFLLQGSCDSKYAPGWQARVDGLVPKVEGTVQDLRTVMRDAGYADADYKLVVMGYPSPMSPDVYDNPNFPGKIPGGCTGYDADLAWGRNSAVPAFELGMRQAAEATGAIYLDNSRLFHGHEACTDNTWARGLVVNITNPFPPDANSVRQSFHPNARGHGAFASCLTQLYNSGYQEAGCADPASTGTPVLHQGAWDDAFKPITNAATGQCVDANGGSSRNNTSLLGWSCHGGRNQSFGYDTQYQSLHTALSQDRCMDVPASNYSAGTGLILWDCHGGTNQRFTMTAGTIRPVAATGLCVTQSAASSPLKLAACDGSASQRFA